MGKIFRKLVSLEEAKRLLLDAVKPKPLGVERVPIKAAYGRVLARDIYAEVDVPPYDRSLRDGYAVRSVDLSGAREDNPIRLRVIGSLEAGSDRNIYIGVGEAVYVATGAPIPGGADAIIMEEYTVRKGDYVEVYKQVSPGEWIQYAGSDISLGDMVLRRGTLLGSREVGVLAALGIDLVPVFRRPKVAVISTGDEIVEVGSPLSPGKIYDVNAYTISSLLVRDGALPEYVGIVGDDVDALREKILYALRNYDMVVTSGSTSVGLRDNLYGVLGSIGSTEFIFHGIEISPGRPTLAAIIDGKLFIGLPGFPVSCLMIYHILFSELVRRFSGLPPIEVVKEEALADRLVRGRLGVKRLEPVFLRRLGDKLYFYPVFASSGAIGTLALADGYVEIGERETYIDVGERRIVYLFEEYIEPSDLVIVSSHSIALDNLIHAYLNYVGNLRAKIIYSGSFGGLKAIEDGYNDLAGLHILDAESGEYNIPIIRKRGLRNVVLYRGFQREFGIVVKKGNPLGISGLEDLFRNDIRFINRAQGSGTRTFVDIWLRKYSEERGIPFEELIEGIKGYFTQAKTHSSVVYHVESGKADMGIASRASVEGHEVDFISLGWEYFDFLVNKDHLERSSHLRRFVDFLESEEALDLLSSMEGVRIPDNYMEKLVDV